MIAALLIALLSAFDAWRFPKHRHDPKRMRAYHVRLMLIQVAAAMLCFVIAGWVQALALAVALAFAVQDIGYHLWRLLFRIETWRDWRPFGLHLYSKPTNLGWLLHASVSTWEWPWVTFRYPPDAPKWVDTAWRLFGLAVAVVILVAGGLA